MSGPQMEGTKDKLHENVMDFWCRTEREDFFDGVGSEITTDFYHRYKEDIAMMKSIGMNSIRTSIQWSRLIKDLETGEPDETAVKFYSDVIEECRKNNIELVLNLHHFDLPVELLQKYGGWESKHVVDLFVKFAQTAFRLFGDKVRYWTTFNEPMVIPEAGYLCGFHYPKKVNRGKQAVQIIYNLNLASAKCIEAFHDMCNGKIGIVLNLTPAYPRSEAEEDLQASEITDLFYNRSFLDPAVHGKFPEKLTELLEENHVLWETSEEEINIIRNNTVDFLGVNYYHPKRVQAREHKLECDQWTPEQYYEEYGMGVEGEEKYRDAEGRIQDDYRIDFYKEHLSQLAKAMEEGSNCFGYHAWTGIDCWSWNNAYKNRYGFIGLDLKTQKRTIKKSGFWYKELSENHGFVIEEE